MVWMVACGDRGGGVAGDCGNVYVFLLFMLLFILIRNLFCFSQCLSFAWPPPPLTVCRPSEEPKLIRMFQTHTQRENFKRDGLLLRVFFIIFSNLSIHSELHVEHTEFFYNKAKQRILCEEIHFNEFNEMNFGSEQSSSSFCPHTVFVPPKCGRALQIVDAIGRLSDWPTLIFYAK